MVEISKYDDMILSFQRYLTYSIFAVCLIGLTGIAYFEGIFHPILLVLNVVSIVILAQSFRPVKEGIGRCSTDFKKWLREWRNGQ